MIAAVFDCVVYVQAAISKRGPAAACMTLAEQGHVEMVASAAILQEVRAVLSRHEFRKKFAHLTEERVEQFLQWLVHSARSLENVPSIVSLPRDPDDVIYVNVALAAQTPFIVTRDNDLLDLMKDDEFRKAYPALTFLDPVAFLTHVRAEMAKDSG